MSSSPNQAAQNNPSEQRVASQAERPLRPVPSSTNWTEIAIRVALGISAVLLFLWAQSM